MNNKENCAEKFSVKSLVVYVCKQYKLLWLAAVLGMVALSALNVIKGQNYSEAVTETDVISAEDLEKSKTNLTVAENSLEASKTKLENQKKLLSEYEDSLTESEEQWKEDIYMSTSADNRCGISTLYQLRGQEELSIDQVLNAFNASFNNMYDDIASQAEGLELTSFNVQRLFTVGVNLSQNQISIRASFETQEGLNQIKDLYHTWMDQRLKEYQVQYPDAAFELIISEENEYVYYDTDIFTAQRNVSDKRVVLQNNITSMSTAIAATQNEIINTETQIKDLTKVIEENEKLWDNTVVLSGKKLVSKTSIIIYLVLGAVVGIIFGIIVCSFRYMYGKTLRDVDDMRCRTGEAVIGTLYSPVYSKKNRIFRKLDRWNGVYEITDMEEQTKRLAVDLSIQLRMLHQTDVTLTGTADPEVIEEVGNKLSVLMEGCSVSIGANPVYNLETVKKMMASGAVVTVEKIGVSKVVEIQRLRDYLRNCRVRVLGGITV